MILSASNRFLKWVGLERCRKPIFGGPTLAGLPGGVAGDLHRLFPVKSNFEFPIRRHRPTVEKSSFQIVPIEPADFENIADNFAKLFCEAANLSEEDLSSNCRQFVTRNY